MKRLVALALAAASLTACVSDREFNREGGVCYRKQTEKWFWVIPVGSNEVQSIDSNCGSDG